MNIKLNAALLGSLCAVASLLPQPAKADEWNKKTEFQFSAPVQIPGKTLAPGKYVFEVADSPSNRNIVQVFSEDADGNDRLITTILAIPDYTAKTPDNPVVHFEERPSGTPEAIQSWLYPGENMGWQFVYAQKSTADASTR